MQYINPTIPEDDANSNEALHRRIAPERGGHGAAGPGGHFIGRCLCRPFGCSQSGKMEYEEADKEEGEEELEGGPSNSSSLSAVVRSHFPNPFFPVPELNTNRDVAIVRAEHIHNFAYGHVNWAVGDMLSIISAPPDKCVSVYILRNG